MAPRLYGVQLGGQSLHVGVHAVVKVDLGLPAQDLLGAAPVGTGGEDVAAARVLLVNLDLVPGEAARNADHFEKGGARTTAHVDHAVCRRDGGRGDGGRDRVVDVREAPALVPVTVQTERLTGQGRREGTVCVNMSGRCRGP